MRDPRVTPDPDLLTLSEARQVAVPITDLRRTPGGARDRQLIYGDLVTVLHHAGDWCLVTAQKDGYCGYVAADTLGPARVATHLVTARSSTAYSAADFKSADRLALSFGSKVVASCETPTFVETELGHIPRQHLHRISDTATDPAAIATLFLGTPYLWGGNGAWGLDCSALVQLACHACHIPCLGDSDQQFTTLGHPVAVGAPFERNDLIFWQGHVAIVTSPTEIIHANAGHMAVATENIQDAIARIEAQGDGAVIGHKRLPALAA